MSRSMLMLMTMALAGCSSNHVESIRGQVVLSSGEPVTQAIIEFYPKDDLRQGDYRALIEEGSFAMEVDPEFCPARPGNFVVSVRRPPALPLKRSLEKMPKWTAIPPKYASHETSPLTTELHVGENNLAPFELTDR